MTLPAGAATAAPPQPDPPPHEPNLCCHETHTGFVVLCGDRAYKSKKPVALDFLDFSAPSSRETALARELHLNRRLAPDVYLGVAHLSGIAGEAPEPVLVMRRIPAHASMSALLRCDGLQEAHLAQLAWIMRRFHAGAKRSAEIDREADADAVMARWRENMRQTRVAAGQLLPAATLAQVEHLALRYIAGRTMLFTERVRSGHIVDGHGDLLADDIFVLPDGVRVLDCMDFDDKLRCVDVVDDMATLAMDLEFQGRADLARVLIDKYADPAPESLWRHYIAYRAMVRAKVDSVRSAQGGDGAAERAQHHLRLAHVHLSRAAVRLCLVGGLPGTGKTTLAQALAQETGSIVISSDEVRAELLRKQVIGGQTGVFGTGRYDPRAKALVYNMLRERATHHLRMGRSVILDASWTSAGDRAAAAELAHSASADLVPLRCVVPAAIAAKRIAHRTGGHSDATPAIAHAMAAAESEWPGGLVVDTSRQLAAATESALAAWRGAAEPE